MIKKQDKNTTRLKRHSRIRNTITGTVNRPRLNVYRSTKHIYAQIIDDVAGNTLCAVSTVEKDVAKAVENMTREAAAYYIGQEAGKRAIAKGIEAVVFDRGGYLYIGRVQKLAEGAREAGLKF